MKHKIDMNLDESQIEAGLLRRQPNKEELEESKKVQEEWQAHPEDTRGPAPTPVEYLHTGASLFREVVLNSISQVHKRGNVQTLRRTRKIDIILNDALKAGGIAEMDEEDYKYVRKAVNSSTEWTNTEGVANLVITIAESIDNAQLLT